MAAADIQWGEEIKKFAEDKTLTDLATGRHFSLHNRNFNHDLPPSLLFRDCYPKIYEQIKDTFDSFEEGSPRALLVVGQPGIGKTAFLFYALVRALIENIPVAWCIRKDTAKWIQFTADRQVEPYDEDCGLRRLHFFDQHIPPQFDPAVSVHGLMIQATSPQRNVYRSYAKQMSALFWVMENWSKSEIMQEWEYRIQMGTRAVTPECYSPSELFDICGPSARSCFEDVNKTNDRTKDFSALETALNSIFLNLEDNHGTIKSAFNGTFTIEQDVLGFRQIFFVNNPCIDSATTDDKLTYDIPTAHFQLRARHYLLLAKLEMDRRMISVFNSCPTAAGLVYELWAKNIILKTKSFELVVPGSRSIDVVAPSQECDFIPTDLTSPLKIDTLYCPTVPNYPTIDYFFITPQYQVIFFQITVAKSHDTSSKGLGEVLAFLNSPDRPHWLPDFSTRGIYFAYGTPDVADGKKLSSKMQKLWDERGVGLAASLNAGADANSLANNPSRLRKEEAPEDEAWNDGEEEKAKEADGWQAFLKAEPSVGYIHFQVEDGVDRAISILFALDEFRNQLRCGRLERDGY